MLLAAVPVISHAASGQPEVKKLTLDNGATVVSRYVPDSSLVTIEIRVLSGLSNEGIYAGSGISHLLEHLLFKGTSHRSGAELNREIKSIGGIVNGSTGLDSAEYHITVPVENFQKALEILVEMVMDPAFTDEELAREKEIILKEIRMHEDDPSSRQFQLLFAQAYRENVYRHPIIGESERLGALTREDVIHYHTGAYTPDRLVVGIAGGIPQDEALRAAAEQLSEYRRGKTGWACDISEEPAQSEPRKASFPADTMLGYIAIGFHTTSFYSPEIYAGDVLSILAGEGADSRMYKRLVKEKQLLYSVASANYTPRYPGLFIVTGVGEPDKLEAARKEIFAVIDEMKSGRIQDEEMERARNAVISDYYRSHESTEDVASSLTTSVIMTGGPDFFEKYVDGIQRVNKEDAQAMLSKYLVESNSTTVYLLPQGYMELADRLSGPVLSDEPERAVTLQNGLRIFAKKRSRLPLVSVTMAFSGGVRAENAGNNGLSTLTTSVLLKGTKRFREEEIVPSVEKTGGTIGAFSGMNSMGIVMTCLSKDLAKDMDILQSVVEEPVFPDGEILKAKTKAIAAVREQENDIFELGMNKLRALIYKGHPYGMNLLGSRESLERITREDMQGFHSERFRPDAAVVTIVGDIDVDKTIDDVSKRFGGWKGKARILSPAGVMPLSGRETLELNTHKAQALVLLGYNGVTVKDPGQYPLSFVSSLLSGSDGLLFRSVREDGGLAYASGALSVPAVDRGYFALFAATTEEKLGAVLGEMLSAVERIARGDISGEDISACRNKLLSEHAVAMETNASLGMMTALDELYGLGFTHYKDVPGKISSITVDDVKKCASDVLGDNYALVTMHSERQ